MSEDRGGGGADPADGGEPRAGDWLWPQWREQRGGGLSGGASGLQQPGGEGFCECGNVLVGIFFV